MKKKLIWLLICLATPGIITIISENDVALGDELDPNLNCYLGNCLYDWDHDFECFWGYCGDMNWDLAVDVIDFWVVVTASGTIIEPCPDGSFNRDISEDGYGDKYDIIYWDWNFNLGRLNLCGLIPLTPLVCGSSGQVISQVINNGNKNSTNLTDLNDLLISGKRGTTDGPTKLKDRLYVFDSNAHYIQWLSLALELCNISIVRGVGNDLYQINSKYGMSRLDDPNIQIVPFGQTAYASEPRYNQPATVYVGIQKIIGEPEFFGRPILDAAFYAGFVYVVPVVVCPEGSVSYTAVAKLQLDPDSNPPYHVVKLYDGPLLPADGNGQYRNNLREIELDSSGNVYVTNANFYNESDILWKFEPNGAVRRLDLDMSVPCVRAPIGMCVSSTTNVLYLAPSLCYDADPASKVIYGFSTEDFNLVRVITVSGMQHITGITEDPLTNSLWMTGFSFHSMPSNPLEMNPYEDSPFYDPYLANVPSGINNVLAICILDANDLAMPLSIVWTGARPAIERCGGADLDESSEVSLPDFAILARHWLDNSCVAPSYCEGADLEPQAFPDGDVDIWDLDVLAEHWLDTGCLGS